MTSTDESQGSGLYNTTAIVSPTCRRPPPVVLGCERHNDTDVWYAECHKRRMLSRIPVFVFALISTYLSIALIFNAAFSPDAIKSSRYGNLLRRSRVFVTCFIAVVMTYSSLSFLVEESPEASCDWFGKAENALYWLSISVVYLLLWFRQRVIFEQDNLCREIPHGIKFLSISTILLVVALPVVNIALFSSSVTFCYDPVLKLCGIKGYSLAIFISELVVPILVPTCLVSLFALPLIVHQLSVRGSIPTSVQSKATVMGVVRRALILSVVCLLTDVGAILCNSYLPLLGSFVTRQMSVFCNMSCMILSFSDWRAVVCFQKPHSNARNTSKMRTSLPLKSLSEKVFSEDDTFMELK